MLRVVHYLNQFYGRLGGEAAASAPLRVVDGAVGPGTRLNELLKPHQGEIVATLVCGDNLAAEEPDAFRANIRERLQQLEPEVVVAGPAFNAGRFGLACGVVCQTAVNDLKVP